MNINDGQDLIIGNDVVLSDQNLRMTVRQNKHFYSLVSVVYGSAASQHIYNLLFTCLDK
jgi:hypothetical protein